MHAIILKLVILIIKTEVIIYFESYYFLRVLSFLQLYFARGPVIGRFCYRQPISIFGGPCLPEVGTAYRSQSANHSFVLGCSA